MNQTSLARDAVRGLAVLSGALGLAVVVAAGGCQQSDHRPQQQVLNPNPRHEVNRIGFGDLPAPTQEAFRKDHPRAKVTDVAVQNTPAGVPWYRVVYKDGGLPAEATYRADGSIVTPEVANYVTRAPEPTTLPSAPSAVAPRPVPPVIPVSPTAPGPIAPPSAATGGQAIIAPPSGTGPAAAPPVAVPPIVVPPIVVPPGANPAVPPAPPAPVVPPPPGEGPSPTTLPTNVPVGR